MDEFNVPVRNALARVKAEDFGLPGSILRVHVSPHPVTYGLPSETAVFADEPIAFQTALPGGEMERWVLASYPSDGRDILLSGWIRGEDRLARRAAAVAMTYGKGKIVLLGFRAQHRAQTHGTYPFLFNALYWSVGRAPPARPPPPPFGRRRPRSPRRGRRAPRRRPAGPPLPRHPPGVRRRLASPARITRKGAPREGAGAPRPSPSFSGAADRHAAADADGRHSVHRPRLTPAGG